jgi:hypothetical protein
MSDNPERPFERCDDCGTPKMIGRTYCITCGKRYSKMKPAGPQPIAPSEGRTPGAWPIAPSEGRTPGPQPIAPYEVSPLPRPDLFPPPSAPFETSDAGPQNGRPAAAMAVAIVLTVAVIATGLVLAFRPATRRTSSGPPASVFPSPSGPPIVLSLAFDRRKPFRFHLANTIDATFTVPSEGFARIIMKIDERAALRVLSVDRKGTAGIQLTIERAAASVNGRRLRVPPGKTLQLRIARDGRILSTGGQQVAAPGASNGGIPSIDQFMPLLPPGPVRPGDSWAKNFSLPFPFGGGTLRYHT